MKAAVGSDDGTIYTVDVIEYQSGLWLVVLWRVNPTLGLQKPERIIRLDILPHQDLGEPGFGPHRFVLNEPIPKAVLDGTTPPEQAHGFVVIDRPDITFPIEPTRH
jgi:hypothetical protein